MLDQITEVLELTVVALEGGGGWGEQVGAESDSELGQEVGA